MNNFSLLSDEEYGKICSAIPHNFIIGYFKMNPKEFSKIRPGYRASAIQNKDAIKLLVTYRERGFISSFVERIANDWLKEIKSVVQEYQGNGESEITSYIHTLYQSFFADNVSAYFKLIDKDYSEEQLNMISNLVSLLKKKDDEQKEFDLSATKFKEELNVVENKFEKSETELKKACKQISDLTVELQELTLLKKQNQELTLENRNLKKENEALNFQINKITHQIKELTNIIGDLQKEKSELEVTIRSKIEEEKEREYLQVVPSFPLAPINMDEFNEYFTYNLESIGINGFPLHLLYKYISNIIFQGRPIICNKCYINTLVNCISNTLVGKKSATIIEYSQDIDEKRISNVLANSERIVVLDNFLGNYNETVLLSLLDQFKSKIVFLSTTYERTLFYLPKDFLLYCNYINLSHIPSFVKSLDPDEDPSILEEKEIVYTKFYDENRYQHIITSVATELGYSVALSEKIAEFVNDDLSACAVLLFNIIPYMNDVLGKNSFNISELLQRYVTRCPYKKVFEEWFMS